MLNYPNITNLLNDLPSHSTSAQTIYELQKLNHCWKSIPEPVFSIIQQRLTAYHWDECDFLQALPPDCSFKWHHEQSKWFACWRHSIFSTWALSSQAISLWQSWFDACRSLAIIVSLEAPVRPVRPLFGLSLWHRPIHCRSSVSYSRYFTWSYHSRQCTSCNWLKLQRHHNRVLLILKRKPLIRWDYWKWS